MRAEVEEGADSKVVFRGGVGHVLLGTSCDAVWGVQDGLVSLRVEVKDKPSSEPAGMLSLSKSLD